MLETSAPILLGGVRSSEPETTDPQESEFARIEALLALRTRNLADLQREFDRRDRLLRDALERLGSSSAQELAALRQRHDAAVDRALDAEFTCAELRFALDETRAQLTAAPAGAAVSTNTDTQALYARVAELEESERQIRERLRAVEQEKAEHEERSLLATRELAEARAREGQRELTWARAHAAEQGGQDALAGERAGLRWRLDEVEQAWHSAAQRARSLQARYDETRDKLSASQAECAELSLRVQTRSARAGELEQALAAKQQELTALRTELTALQREHAAQSDAFQTERRLSDALAGERAQRRKLAVTVRALQAASEAGEAIAPWIDELVQLLAENVSLPPRSF